MSRARVALNRPWLRSSPADLLPFVPVKFARDLLVVQTFAVDGAPGLGVHHWELHFATDADAAPLVLLTRDAGSYARALDLEGTETRVELAYHPSKRPDGIPCLVLDDLKEIAK
jgi:hypothetical protein